MQASDKTAWLRLAGVPFERPGTGGDRALKLVDVELRTGMAGRHREPGFGSRELSLPAVPGRDGERADEHGARLRLNGRTRCSMSGSFSGCATATRRGLRAPGPLRPRCPQEFRPPPARPPPRAPRPARRCPPPSPPGALRAGRGRTGLPLPAAGPRSLKRVRHAVPVATIWRPRRLAQRGQGHTSTAT